MASTSETIASGGLSTPVRAGVIAVSAALIATVVTGGAVLRLRWVSGGARYDEILVAVFAAGTWVLAAYFGVHRAMGRRALLVGGAAAAAYLIADLTSVNPWISVIFTMPVVAAFLTYLAARWAPGDARSLAWAIAWFGLFLAGTVVASSIVGLVERSRFVSLVVAKPIVDLSLAPRGFGVTPNPNVAAMILLLPLGFAVGLSLDGTMRSRAGAAAMAAGIAVGILVTGSRGALLGGLGGLGVGAFSILRHREGGSVARIWTWAVGGLVLAGGIIAWVARNHPAFLNRSFVRGAIWEAAGRLATERPLFGWGPGTLALMLPGAFADPVRFRPEMWHAHDTYLEALAELGVLGVAVIVIGATAALVYHRKRESGSRAPGLNGVRLGAFIGFAALGVHGVFDSAQLYPGVLAMIGFGAGVLSLDRESGRLATSWAPGFRRIAAVTVCVGVVGAGCLYGHAAAAVQMAVNLADSGDWEGASLVLESTAADRPTPASVTAMLARSTAAAGIPVSPGKWVSAATERDPFDWVSWALAAQDTSTSGSGEPVDMAVTRSLEAGAMSSTEGALAILGLPGLDSLRSQMLVDLVRRYPGVVGSVYWAGLSESESNGAIVTAAQGGVACQLLTALGESNRLSDVLSATLSPTCIQQIDFGDILNADNIETEHVLGISGLFYDAVFRGDDIEMQRLAGDLEGAGDSPLSRRIRGIAALVAGDENSARQELAAGAALGDLESVNLLLAEFDSGARSALVALGNGIAASMRPIGVQDGEAITTEFNQWWGLATYLPSFSDGILLPQSWIEATPWSIREFEALTQP